MAKYRFYDTDRTGFEERDICGEDYARLLRACEKYCSAVSLRIVSAEDADVNMLEAYRIDDASRFEYAYVHYYAKDTPEASAETRYYRLNADVMRFFLGRTDSVFSWISAWGWNNPEDPVFYREDGSVFFESTVHEGECTLTLREGEEGEGLLANGMRTSI